MTVFFLSPGLASFKHTPFCLKQTRPCQYYVCLGNEVPSIVEYQKKQRPYDVIPAIDGFSSTHSYNHPYMCETMYLTVNLPRCFDCKRTRKHATLSSPSHSTHMDRVRTAENDTLLVEAREIHLPSNHIKALLNELTIICTMSSTN